MVAECLVLSLERSIAMGNQQSDGLLFGTESVRRWHTNLLQSLDIFSCRISNYLSYI